MRTFYIFKINKNFYSLYKENPTSLYNILKQISTLMKNDINYAYSIFNQIAEPIDKNTLDRKIFIDLHNLMPYNKKEDIHIYSNMYLDEETKMEIKDTYIRIDSNKDIAYFLRVLDKYNDEFFVCDFKNKDYFYLSDVKILV